MRWGLRSGLTECGYRGLIKLGMRPGQSFGRTRGLPGMTRGAAGGTRVVAQTIQDEGRIRAGTEETFARMTGGVIVGKTAG